jgi:hypothetical protein
MRVRGNRAAHWEEAHRDLIAGQNAHTVLLHAVSVGDCGGRFLSWSGVLPDAAPSLVGAAMTLFLRSRALEGGQGAAPQATAAEQG